MPTDTLAATQRAAAKASLSRLPGQAISAPRGPPPPSEDKVAAQHFYNGPLNFNSLATTFRPALEAQDARPNVLFVTSNLKSVASLLPLACDMVRTDKNRVHMMLTSRDDIPVEDIKRVNGLANTRCVIWWHDGRPDFSAYSTDLRMQKSVAASLGHLAAVTKFDVVLVDSAEREDEFCSKAVKERTKSLGLPLIELPPDAAERLDWLARLSASSLRMWNEVSIDVLIHSPPDGSGSIIRLLKSLESADYFGFPYPHLTIELPSHIDPPLSQFLSDFRWPPNSKNGDTRLSIRRRILTAHVDPTEASIRQLESFHPGPRPNSHLLVLSPEVELSTLYFQFLLYSVLEYKYSDASLFTSQDLMGISLETPSRTLDNKNAITAVDDGLRSPLFRYEAPNSHAALYFGEKWAELHSFLSNRLATSNNAESSDPANDRLAYPVAKEFPAWLGYALELCRARGYTMLYPSAAPSSSASSPNQKNLYQPLATIHHESYHAPEEYTDMNSRSSRRQHNHDDNNDNNNNDNNNNNNNRPISKSNDQSTAAATTTTTTATVTPKSLLSYLSSLSSSSSSSSSSIISPFDPLNSFSSLPILLHTGEWLLLADAQMALNQAAAQYAELFRREIGGCHHDEEEEKRKKEMEGGRSKNLVGSSDGDGDGSYGHDRDYWWWWSSSSWSSADDLFCPS